MTMDFTLEKYAELLDALKAYGFDSLVLRHDVDLLPGNSLRTVIDRGGGFMI